MNNLNLLKLKNNLLYGDEDSKIFEKGSTFMKNGPIIEALIEAHFSFRPKWVFRLFEKFWD